MHCKWTPEVIMGMTADESSFWHDAVSGASERYAEAMREARK